MDTASSIERVLRVLSHLQRRTTATAADLAHDLGVTDRSIRRDITRLRTLGYPIEAEAGPGGGYRLGSGTRMPPLLLDQAEAVATAIALRLSTSTAVVGGADAARGALSKLEQVMPPGLRATVQALHGATSLLQSPSDEIEAGLLAALAHACHDRLRVRFDYTDGRGRATQRRAEPVQMITTGLRWYLMAWDLDREDWRTFRLDRLEDLEVTTWRFAPREHPDPTDYVHNAIATAPYEHHVLVRVRAAPAELSALVPPQVGTVEPDAEDGWCRLRVGGVQLEWVAFHLALMDVEMQVLEPAEFGAVAARLSSRLASLASRATRDSGDSEAGGSSAKG
jgi:predicted DNA-binding transcriptional regulator YafY